MHSNNYELHSSSGFVIATYYYNTEFLHCEFLKSVVNNDKFDLIHRMR